ncbi:MAG: hypothetical protein M3Q07_19205 [Pseudobdellovibrionaceae bacterium]|nr:hypothetical protein [Pseudobdellovibrionaceae bacterium]
MAQTIGKGLSSSATILLNMYDFTKASWAKFALWFGTAGFWWGSTSQ